MSSISLSYPILTAILNQRGASWKHFIGFLSVVWNLTAIFDIVEYENNARRNEKEIGSSLNSFKFFLKLSLDLVTKIYSVDRR